MPVTCLVRDSNIINRGQPLILYSTLGGCLYNAIAAVRYSSISSSRYPAGHPADNVFPHDVNRCAYLDYLGKTCRRHRVVEIGAYCRTGNHGPFIAVPSAEDSLPRCFSEARVR